MAWQAAGKIPSGLDSGETKLKKKAKKPQPKNQSKDAKIDDDVEEDQDNSEPNPKPIRASKQNQPQPQPQPKILPGESLSSFSVRVDQSLPLSAIARSSTNPNLPSDIKVQARTTKHNKRLQRMIADWRTTDAKLKEKREEREEDADNSDGALEEDLLWDPVRAARVDRKGKKKNSKKGKEVDDPWKELEKKRREETRQKSLQDVVKAPPELKKVKSKFKVMEEDYESVDRKKGDRKLVGDDVLGVDVKDVPNSVGSLRRREELSGARRAVIEGYRKMVGKKAGRQSVRMSGIIA